MDIRLNLVELAKVMQEGDIVQAYSSSLQGKALLIVYRESLYYYFPNNIFKRGDIVKLDKTYMQAEYKIIDNNKGVLL